MGLHVGIRGTKEIFCAFNSKFLCHVHVLAPTVESTVRIAFRIFVRKHTCLCGHDGRTGDILRSDQFELVGLPFQLQLDDMSDFRVGFFYDILTGLKHVFHKQSPLYRL